MLTVYFDTSFFINLRDAPEDQASQVLQELNHLRARHVLSDVIFRELLTSTAPRELQYQLVRRVQLFDLAPLKIRQTSWVALLAEQTEREQYAAAFRTIDEAVGVTKSLSLAAGSKLREEEIADLIRADAELLSSMGWLTADGDVDLAAMEAWGRRFLTDLFGCDPEQITPAKAKSVVRENLRRRFGDDIVDRVLEHDRLAESALVASSKPVRHASRKLSSRAAKDLLNTYRDTEHMATFVEHAEVIDLLQIDQPQMNLAGGNPEHRLRATGLLDRCFVAKSLDDVVPQIKERLRLRPTN